MKIEIISWYFENILVCYFDIEKIQKFVIKKYY